MDKIWWLRIYFFIFAIQAIEYILLAKKTEQVWPGNELARDFFPRSGLVSFAFSTSIFFIVCFLRLFCLVGIIYPSLFFALIIFFTQIYFALRYRGSFNGGSDYLGLMISLGLCLILLFPNFPLIDRGVMYYLALQLTFSYFFAGQIKVKEILWRRGEALPAFFKQTIFIKNSFLESLIKHKKLMFLLSWFVMLWEISFPLVWINSTICLIYCFIGLLFHLGNFWIFGLNRFLLLWPLLYPILYLAVDRIH
jgi:hypothetical protein